MPQTLAAADIGSNTVHLLVAQVNGERVQRVANENVWIALGEVVARHGLIPDEQMHQLILAIRQFREICAKTKASSLYVFATEAMRAASNHEEVLERIARDTGVVVDLISSKREAELSFRGTVLDCPNPTVLFEVGGGSAQVANVVGKELREKFSLPLGTGKVIADTGLSSPCPRHVFLSAEAYIQERLRGCDFVFEPGVVAASGGVARGLWRALHPDGDRNLGLAELDYVVYAGCRWDLATLMRRFNVKPKRAGTLLPGAMVYAALLRKFGVQEMMVSEYGVREGAVLEMAAGRVEPCLV